MFIEQKVSAFPYKIEQGQFRPEDFVPAFSKSDSYRDPANRVGRLINSAQHVAQRALPAVRSR